MSTPFLRDVSGSSKPRDKRRQESPADIPTVSRGEFLRQFGEDYRAGQHATFLGPTQRGKTTLCIQCLEVVVSPELPCVLYAGKPPGRDKTMAAAADKLNLRIVEEWPPPTGPINHFKDKKRNGYVLRPHHRMEDTDADDANLKRQFGTALKHNYASKTPVITVLDERHHVESDLGLKKESNAALLRGAPVNSQWNLLQRGRHVSYLVYDAPEHIFIFFDPDQSNRKRYAEIGGVDPRLIMQVTDNLKTSRTDTGMTISQCLYIRRSGPELMIVDTE